MVQAGKCAISSNYLSAGGGARVADFVGKTQGKLRDHYRIGKILGTGKLSSNAFVIDLNNSTFLGAFGEVRMCVHRES